jgi:alpha-beta hydrolase superfamily lysophospholipase
VRRLRTVTPVLPTELGRQTGLSYAFWAPAEGRVARAGILILHGAGSCKERHYDFARAALALDLAVIVFDQRGHGESDGPMDSRMLADAIEMTALLRDRIGPDAPLALRGSSMGGYLAILAAGPARARAVVAICPASAGGLRRALAAQRLDFDSDAEAFDAFLAAGELEPALRALEAPLLLLHAEGDEQVPVQHSRELSALATAPGSRLITVPGGHHRSIQHDEELQAVSLRFIVRAMAGETHRSDSPPT